MLPRIFGALEESDAVILRYLHKAKARPKPDGSEVTIADRAAERLLRRRLQESWPGDAVFGEEYGFSSAGGRGNSAAPGSADGSSHSGRGPNALGSQGRCWLLDPIDGTASYVLGLPMFGTLVALLIDGEPVFGCIRLSGLGETTYAARGFGCWLRRDGGGPRRVHVAPRRGLSTAKVGLTLFKEQALADRPDAQPILDLTRQVGRLRLVGDCVQYPLLCRGALDAAIDPLMKPWDIGALVPCVLEAGGSVSDLNGETSRIIERSSFVAASSDRLRREICRSIARG
jgi:histidinol-phosphatase